MFKLTKTHGLFQKIKTTLTSPAILLIIGAIVTSLPGSFTTEALYPDGQRYLFNGLLVHDLFRDGDLFNAYSYAKQYYMHYPAFNLPYGPPFLAVQFASAFYLFGISFASARLVIVCYTILSALACWKLISNVDKNKYIISIACIFLIFNPLTLQYSRDIASEIPVIFFSIVTLYTIYQYLVHHKNGYGLATALFLSLGYLTKQHIVPLGFGIFLYIVLKGKISILRKRETILSIFLLLVFTVPYTLLTIQFSSEDLGIKLFPPFSPQLLYGYFKTAAHQIPTLFLLSLLGFFIEFRKRNNMCQLCLCWIFSWYMFFTFIYGYYIGEPRYILIIIPAIIYPAAIATFTICASLCKKYHGFIITIISFCYIVVNLYFAPVFHINGYSDAGKHVGTLAQSNPILFAGNYDGNFLFGIRQACPDKSPLVFRGDQWLARRLWWGELKNEESIKSVERITDFIKEYRVGFVVLEIGNSKLSKFQENINLSKVMSDKSQYELIASMPVQTNYFIDPGRILQVYKTPFFSDKPLNQNPIQIRPSANLIF